ncbi:hypothetical protein D3C72_2589770 [compost metagenome]
MSRATKSTAKMTKNGRAISESRLSRIDSSFAVTLKVGRLGRSSTEMTAGSRCTVWANS